MVKTHMESPGDSSRQQAQFIIYCFLGVRAMQIWNTMLGQTGSGQVGIKLVPWHTVDTTKNESEFDTATRWTELRNSAIQEQS